MKNFDIIEEVKKMKFLKDVSDVTNRELSKMSLEILEQRADLEQLIKEKTLKYAKKHDGDEEYMEKLSPMLRSIYISMIVKEIEVLTRILELDDDDMDPFVLIHAAYAMYKEKVCSKH